MNEEINNWFIYSQTIKFNSRTKYKLKTEKSLINTSLD